MCYPCHSQLCKQKERQNKNLTACSLRIPTYLIPAACAAMATSIIGTPTIPNMYSTFCRNITSAIEYKRKNASVQSCMLTLNILSGNRSHLNFDTLVVFLLLLQSSYLSLQRLGDQLSSCHFVHLSTTGSSSQRLVTMLWFCNFCGPLDAAVSCHVLVLLSDSLTNH